MAGDGALRKAAQQENVAVMGTIAVLDKLRDEHLITDSEYGSNLKDLLSKNEKTVRLPKSELESRIRKLEKD